MEVYQRTNTEPIVSVDILIEQRWTAMLGHNLRLQEDQEDTPANRVMKQLLLIVIVPQIEVVV